MTFKEEVEDEFQHFKRLIETKNFTKSEIITFVQKNLIFLSKDPNNTIRSILLNKQILNKLKCME